MSKPRGRAPVSPSVGLAQSLLAPLLDAGVLSKARFGEIRRELNLRLGAPPGVARAKGRTTGETFWERFQQQFGFAQVRPGQRITPMNAANLCPEPERLLNVANVLRFEYNKNVAQQMRTGRGQRVVELETARKLLAQGLGLKDPSSLAIVRNASEGNNAINGGYRKWLDPSAAMKNVVVWKENHPTNLAAWRLRAANGGGAPLFEVREVSFEPTETDDAIAEKFIKQIDAGTRFITYSETANSTGFRIPEVVMRKIWVVVQERFPDCHVHVDGTMSWGARRVDLSTAPCHSFVSSAHKWFLGPKETGILYMSPKKVGNFEPNIFAYDYQIKIHPWDKLPPDAQRFELIGQRDDVNIITLAATQAFWNELVAQRDPYQRVSELAQYLMEKLEGQWELITPRNPDRSWGVVRVHAPRGNRAASLYSFLYDRWRIAGSGDDSTFRLCPHVYNTRADIDRAVDGMNAWRKD